MSTFLVFEIRLIADNGLITITFVKIQQFYSIDFPCLRSLRTFIVPIGAIWGELGISTPNKVPAFTYSPTEQGVFKIESVL